MFGKWLKIYFILIVGCCILPVCAEDSPVYVQRQVKPQKKEMEKAEKKNNPAEKQVDLFSNKDNLTIIKAKGENYAKRRLSVPKSREHELSKYDFCDISRELEQYGATNIFIIMFDTKHDKEDKPIINGRNFSNSRYCLKIYFDYNKKRYETGWCRA